jgi:hypothetical protein
MEMEHQYVEAMGECGKVVKYAIDDLKTRLTTATEMSKQENLTSEERGGLMMKFQEILHHSTKILRLLGHADEPLTKHVSFCTAEWKLYSYC